MSASTAEQAYAPAPPSGSGAGLPAVTRAEWIVLRSVRSTWWTLLVMVLLTFAIGVGACAATKSPVDAERAANTALGGFLIGQLLILALATVFAAGEFTTGMMISSALAVPRRGRLLAAKAVVISLLSLAVSLVLGLACYAAGGAVLGDKVGGAGLVSGDGLRALLCQAVTTILLALLGLGVGTVVRSTAGGITLAIGLTFVLPFALAAIPVDFLHRLVKYLPTVSVGATGIPWSVLITCAVWAAAALAAATVLGARRDI